MKKRGEFKWNPFTLMGESPSSLRFKQEPDPLEFATKEDLEIIKNDPHLSKVHQAMLAGVNKKFQSWAEENKQLKAQLANLQQEIEELQAGLKDWETFYTTNEEAILKAIKGRMGEEGEEEEMKTTKRSGKKDYDEDRLDALIKQLNQAAEEIDRRFNHLGTMLNLSIQLNELARRNPELDTMKVLDAALKGGYMDLERAYKDAYEEDIINKKVEEKLKPRLDEELLKMKTEVEPGSGSVPNTFSIQKELPKSMLEAGLQFLEERSKEQSKP